MKKYVLSALLLGVVLISFAGNAFANHLTKPTKNTDYEIPSQITNYFVPTTDPNIIYNHYAQTGGDEIRTKDAYYAYCKVWVQTTVSKSFVNGYPRINPDNTYYPGDGFGYSFSYGWDGNKGCRNFKVCQLESSLVGGSTKKCDLAKLIPLQKSVTKARLAPVAGIGEIPIGVAPKNSLHLTVAAERYFCFYLKKSKITCGWTTITATGIYQPNVLEPKAGLAITQEFLKDRDGFVSGNVDETYYLWDAINLVHTPTYKWKDERLGTISILITKHYDMNLEKEFQCEFRSCNYTLVQNGFEPWPRTYRYGDGTTLMNVTTDNEIRKHTVYYKAELLNLGRPIHRHENKTEVLLVRYDPVFDMYPYLILKDGHMFSWGNRPAVAIHYFGSGGGGQDDKPGIHEKRRSKINAYAYSSYAFDPILKKLLGMPLVWTESHPPTPTQKMCSEADIESDSFESGKTDTAMFIKKGHGKIIFNHSILHTMLAKRYINATIDNTLQSSSFAGIQTKNLTHYKYQYPDVKFGNPVKVLTYHSDGTRTSLPVSVRMLPDAEKGAMLIHDYLCKKISQDTKSSEFAEIVVNDMYGKTNQQNGTGYVTLKSNNTSTWFPEFYQMLVPDVMGLELNAGYGMPSPYEITITVGEKTRMIKRIVNFLSPFTHIANLDADNTINVTVVPGLVRLYPDKKFGEIVRVTVNGNDLNKDCSGGCTVVNQSHELKIEAWNLWGGHAMAKIGKPYVPVNVVDFDWNLAAVAAFVAMLGWLFYRLARQAINYFRNIHS